LTYLTRRTQKILLRHRRGTGTIRVPAYVDRESEEFLKSQVTASLSEPWGQINAAQTLADSIHDYRDDAIEARVDAEANAVELSRFRWALTQLSNREWACVKWALDGATGVTIARTLHITREAVRMIQLRARGKLRELLVMRG
jgi:DNA-binding CsgD family transcriptional regulator